MMGNLQHPKGQKTMYRKILLASVGAIALTGSAAFAADLPYQAPPPVYVPPPPIFTWTGFYIGGQVGYAGAPEAIASLHLTRGRALLSIDPSAVGRAG